MPCSRNGDRYAQAPLLPRIDLPSLQSTPLRTVSWRSRCNGPSGCSSAARSNEFSRSLLQSPPLQSAMCGSQGYIVGQSFCVYIRESVACAYLAVLLSVVHAPISCHLLDTLLTHCASSLHILCEICITLTTAGTCLMNNLHNRLVFPNKFVKTAFILGAKARCCQYLTGCPCAQNVCSC